MWDVKDKGSLGYEFSGRENLGLRNVGDMGSLECRMLGMWHAVDVICLRCEMFEKWIFGM